jgi:hypothetical protein
LPWTVLRQEPIYLLARAARIGHGKIPDDGMMRDRPLGCCSPVFRRLGWVPKLRAAAGRYPERVGFLGTSCLETQGYGTAIRLGAHQVSPLFDIVVIEMEGIRGRRFSWVFGFCLLWAGFRVLGELLWVSLSFRHGLFCLCGSWRAGKEMSIACFLESPCWFYGD